LIPGSIEDVHAEDMSNNYFFTLLFVRSRILQL